MRISLAACLCFAASGWSQTNPLQKDPNAAEQGRAVFRIYCAPCHGIKAQGGRGPDLTRGVYAAGERDVDLFRTIQQGVPGTEMPSFSELTDEVLWQLVTYIRSAARRDSAPPPGNAAAGEALFRGKGGCGACHRVGNKGSAIGPDLTRAGRTRSYSYLRESVVAPDEDITPGYETITVVTRDGKRITGVERGYDNFSAQFVELSGEYHSFERSDVKTMEREYRSLMPGNYGTIFTPAELDDLLAYLNSLKGAR